MTIFKSYLKVIYSSLIPVIIYTILLIFFSIFIIQTSKTKSDFTNIKPTITIINHDSPSNLTADLINYLKNYNNVVEYTPTELKEALFYRQVDLIITIPENFTKELLNKQYPDIQIEQNNTYESSLTIMHLKQYLKTAYSYLELEDITEPTLITNINKALTNETNVTFKSSSNIQSLEKTNIYYNFASYSLLASCIYVICLVMSSFQKSHIQKRTMISSTNYHRLNTQLLLANGLFAFTLWFIYGIISFCLFKEVMFSLYGLIYLLNSFIFTFSTLTISLFISHLIKNKDSISSIVNVLALGSSFLCGAFVPMSLLPDNILTIAHIFPTYYYIKTNELLTTIDHINLSTLTPIFHNLIIILLLSLIFIILTNLVTYFSRKSSQ